MNRLYSGVTDAGRCLRQLASVYRLVPLLVVVAMTAGSVRAHDASSYGGVFRSRNLGGTWLRADVGLFLNAALVVAVDPQNGSHLLAGTDLGLLGSRNGGLSWTPEAPDLIFGAVFAVTFLGDGERAICAAQSGVFRLEAGQWNRALVPEAATPAKTLVTGASADRIYLLGRDRLFTSSDSGRTFVEVAGRWETSAMTALAIVRSRAEIIVAVIDGQMMTSEDGGQHWRPGGLGKDGQPVETVVADAHVSKRVWAARAGRVYASDEPSSSWRAVGRALPEPATTIRGIAANAEATTLSSPRTVASIAARMAATAGRSRRTIFQSILRQDRSRKTQMMQACSIPYTRLCLTQKCGAPPSRPTNCPGDSTSLALPVESASVCSLSSGALYLHGY